MYGDILGSNSGVIAYANRKAKNFKPAYHFELGIYTGFRYQCVEYARRWMISVHNLTFKNVMCAFNIWEVKSVRDLRTSELFPLIGFANGSQEPPRAGNLLIYAAGDHIPFGHVAVITHVDPEFRFIRIAEQNEFDHYWHGDYSRELKLQYKDELFWIIDKYEIIGWMAYHQIAHLKNQQPKL